MNPAIPIDEECDQSGRTQNHTVKIFYTDNTLVSLPDKDALLLLLHLKQIHEERQKLNTSVGNILLGGTLDDMKGGN
jgi:hypothetical protein